METTHLFFTLLLGGLLGTIGQGIRIILGIGKGNADTKTITKQLLLGLGIGFIAGAISIMIKNPNPNEVMLSNKDLLLTVMSAGYAGADFIEGTLNALKNKIKV